MFPFPNKCSQVEEIEKLSISSLKRVEKSWKLPQIVLPLLALHLSLHLSFK